MEYITIILLLLLNNSQHQPIDEKFYFQDSLDVKPEHNIKNVYKSACIRSQYGFLDVDRIYIYKSGYDIGYIAYILDRPDVSLQRNEYKEIEDSLYNKINIASIYMLSWQILKAKNIYLYNYLFLSKHYDSLDQPTWKIFILMRDSAWTEGYLASTRTSDEGNCGNSCAIRQFNHLPTNNDIYQFLRDWENKLYGAVNFRLNKKKKIGDFTFVDGAVRKKTWRAIVGMPPIKFFPNGK
ncbi:MAG: hypothetical protein DYG96_02680 [Chlorobi bacterium CHB2]|nr:hypothetical protein [Chlorobi bacterium CHB2]